MESSVPPRVHHKATRASPNVQVRHRAIGEVPKRYHRAGISTPHKVIEVYVTSREYHTSSQRAKISDQHYIISDKRVDYCAFCRTSNANPYCDH